MTGLDNLKIYMMAEDLEIKVHHLTEIFPADERFRSIDQLRRSSSSTRSNIAEGYTRFAYGDKIHHFHIARAEAEETRRHLIMARRKKFVPQDEVDPLIDGYENLHKGINGYIRFMRRQANGQKIDTRQLQPKTLIT